MKVAVLTGSVSRNAGGLFVSVRRLTQTVAQSDDMRVDVLSLKDEYTGSDVGCWGPIRPRTFDVIGPRAFGLSPGLKRSMLAMDADLLHLHGIWMYTGWASLKWQRRGRGPVVISPRGMLDPLALAVSRWKKRMASSLFERDNLESAGCIHALCESEYRSVRAQGLTNPVAIIPNGIDLPGEAREVPAPWADSIGPDKRVLLFLGRISQKKNVHGLLGAWQKLHRDGSLGDWVLAIAGWSRANAAQYEAQVRQQVVDSGLADVVSFMGPLHDERKEAAFRNAHGFVLPSRSEGLPMAVLEAWSYGLPVVMTAECNIPEGFAAEAAVEVRPDVESIRRGLAGFLAMPEEERRTLGRNGRRLVETRFTWPAVAGEMIAVYEWLLRGGPEPECVRTD